MRWRERKSVYHFPALGVAFVMMVTGWWLTQSVPGGSPAEKAVHDHIVAAQAGRCEFVWSGFSSRTKALMLTVYDRRALTEQEAVKRFCNYSPGISDMETFIPDTVHAERIDDEEAVVTAKYKYDRFFGFFGEGKAKARFRMVKERGAWKIDHTEEIDPRSRSNMDAAAMGIMYQGWTAQGWFRDEYGYFTDVASYIQGQLPGYKFGPILVGVADRASQPGTLYVALADKDAVCLSTRSGTGTLVMIKMIHGAERLRTYQYGQIPSRCDREPLARDFHGTSSGIRYND